MTRMRLFSGVRFCVCVVRACLHTMCTRSMAWASNPMEPVLQVPSIHHIDQLLQHGEPDLLVGVSVSITTLNPVECQSRVPVSVVCGGVTQHNRTERGGRSRGPPVRR